MAQSFQLLMDDAQAALLIADPWESLSSFFEISAARLVRDRGLHQAMFGPTSHEKPPIRRDLVDAVVELFARAKAAGVLRPDIEAMDAIPIYAMMGVASDVGGVVSPEQWRRSLALFLDGMRATDRAPLSSPRPSRDVASRRSGRRTLCRRATAQGLVGEFGASVDHVHRADALPWWHDLVDAVEDLV
jgi:hypothetical protein